MARARNRDAVMKTLRKALDEDRTKTFTAEISKLGLVEMTRQNVTEGVREIMTRACPTCDGEGVIRSEETIAIEFERRLRDVRPSTPTPAFLVQMNPRVTRRSSPATARAALRALEAETGKVFYFEGSEGLPLDHFDDHLRAAPTTRPRSARCPFRPGRRAARPHRRAAHVRRRRRGREDRRLHHLGGRRGSATSARSAWCASTRSGAPRRSRRCSTRMANRSR